MNAADFADVAGTAADTGTLADGYSELKLNA